VQINAKTFGWFLAAQHRIVQVQTYRVQCYHQSETALWAGFGAVES